MPMSKPDNAFPAADSLATLKDSAKGTLADQVTAALKAHIANGEVLPGARLPTEPVPVSYTHLTLPAKA